MWVWVLDSKSKAPTALTRRVSGANRRSEYVDSQVLRFVYLD